VSLRQFYLGPLYLQDFDNTFLGKVGEYHPTAWRHLPEDVQPPKQLSSKFKYIKINIWWAGFFFAFPLLNAVTADSDSNHGSIRNNTGI
jgi:hypothetical protein